MLENKNYAEMTLEELVSEEKKIKSRRTTAAVLIGLVVGVAIWAATHQKIFLTIVLLVVPFLVVDKSASNLKSIQAEISSKGAVS